MKTFEVIIDIGSKTFLIDADDKEQAEQLAIAKFEGLPTEEQIDEYWIGESNEVVD